MRSIGATAVLEMVAEMPPFRKDAQTLPDFCSKPHPRCKSQLAAWDMGRNRSDGDSLPPQHGPRGMAEKGVPAGFQMWQGVLWCSAKSPLCRVQGQHLASAAVRDEVRALAHVLDPGASRCCLGLPAEGRRRSTARTRNSRGSSEHRELRQQLLALGVALSSITARRHGELPKTGRTQSRRGGQRQRARSERKPARSSEGSRLDKGRRKGRRRGKRT